MAFRMAHGSLFAVLLRSPWWYSALIAVALIAIGAAVVDGKYLILGVFTSFPFLGISGFALYKQSQLPSRERIVEIAEHAQQLSAMQVANKIAESYTSARFDKAIFKGADAELELTRGNRKILVSTKRFKARNTGIEPFKRLLAAGEKSEATAYIYVALGDVSQTAQSFATDNNIELVQATELAAFFDGKVKIE